MVGGASLTALCAVASFIWLSAGHSFTEYSRLSALLALAIPSTVSFAASFLSCVRFSPGGGYKPLESHSALSIFPKRPRPYFLPLLVLLLAVRVELYQQLGLAIQCAKPGILAFLPFIILLYELLPGRRVQLNSEDDEDEDDYLDSSSWDRLGFWFRRSPYVTAVSVLTLCLGVFLSSSSYTRSTFFCGSFENAPLILTVQWLGLLADGAIVNLAWRTLAWCRSTRSRLKTLGSILMLSAFGVELLSLLFVQGRGRQYANVPQINVKLGLDNVHQDILHTAVCGLAFSAFFISSSLVMCEDGPLTLAGTLAFFSAFVTVVEKIFLVGTWENTLPGLTYYALLCICLGFFLFVYANSMQTIVVIPRPLFVIVLAVLFATGTVLISIRSQSSLKEHLLQEVIYQTRIEADRWLTHASVSQNVRTATAEYRERCQGRDPPPKFDVWFEYAMARKSPVMDHFAQMEKDLLPFWGMAPDKIRESVKQLAGKDDIAIVSVQEGVPSYSFASPARDASHGESLNALMSMMETFSAHLPDIQFAVNLSEQPRVLAPWDDVERLNTVGRRGLGKAVVRRAAPSDEIRLRGQMFTSVSWNGTAFACPPGSKVRSRTDMDMHDFCFSCARPHSRDQFLTNWELSLDLCHQPDMLHLHGFHIRPPNIGVSQKMMPIFSRSKTDSYSDILIPLPSPGDSHDGKGGDFETAQRKLFWRGRPDDMLTPFSLERGHQQRVVHMAQNASDSDRTTVLLHNSPSGHAFEDASTKELNSVLSLDVSFKKFDCTGSGMNAEICNAFVREFGNKNDAESSPPTNSYRFLLVMDTDTGPPPNLVSALHSGSVPFVASMFREWYTERLIPWAHFVPVDMRFHGLHSTLLYFAGIPAGAKINGREPWPNMSPREEDGKWIADNGRRWAERALRREDMEVYLFRLLLEWARLIDDKRDETA